MTKMLHITNGDSAADIIKACPVPGDVLSWRDPMHHGPCPLVGSLDELSRIRISYLAGDDKMLYALLQKTNAAEHSQKISEQQPKGKTKREQHGFSERDATLEKSGDCDEVILWFEHDLLDQLQLIQLLDWFSQHADAHVQLSLICIDHFDGVQNFRGIGQLSATQMASLLPHRKSIDQSHFDVAGRFWRAFCQSEPEALLSLSHSADSNRSCLPFLQPAIVRHLQEYPWVSDGLTRTERQLLQLFDAGTVSPVRAFVANMDFESHLFIGDWRTYTHIHELCRAEQPLLACDSGAEFEYPPNSQSSAEQFKEQKLSITETGRKVLAGKLSALDSMHRDSWLGGVHVNSEKGLWCWDDEQDRLIKLAV